MAAGTSRMRWLLAAPLALFALYALLCMGLYLASARHLPDRLEPAQWRAPPDVRALLLEVEAGMSPGDVVPRLHPLTFIPRDALRLDIADPSDAYMRGWRLLSGVVRIRHSSLPRMISMQRAASEIAMAIRLSREWTTDEIADTILAESAYGRCSVGIDQAALSYFGLPLDQLRPQETLVLISLLKGPSWYDIDRRRERFSKRFAQLAAALGHDGPDWHAETALSRLRPAGCIGFRRQ